MKSAYSGDAVRGLCDQVQKFPAEMIVLSGTYLGVFCVIHSKICLTLADHYITQDSVDVDFILHVHKTVQEAEIPLCKHQRIISSLQVKNSKAS